MAPLATKNNKTRNGNGGGAGTTIDIHGEITTINNKSLVTTNGVSAAGASRYNK